MVQKESKGREKKTRSSVGSTRYSKRKREGKSDDIENRKITNTLVCGPKSSENQKCAKLQANDLFLPPECIPYFDRKHRQSGAAAVLLLLQ